MSVKTNLSIIDSNTKHELKSGREDKLSLEEIGHRAIAIRDWNNKRITVKNKIAELLGCSVKEIKKEHLSE